jgi:hypothetical protein
MKIRIVALSFSMAILLAACGSSSSISGEYEGKGIVLEFKSNNAVYVKTPFLQTKTNYTIDDDKIIISMPSPSPSPDIVLQNNGKFLVGPANIELNKKTAL